MTEASDKPLANRNIFLRIVAVKWVRLSSINDDCAKRLFSIYLLEFFILEKWVETGK